MRQEILEVRCVRLQFAQVRPQIGVGEVGKTDGRYVSLQHEVTIVMQSYILHHHRIQRSDQCTTEVNRVLESAEKGDEERDIGRHQFRFMETESEGDIMRRLREIDGIGSREAQLHSTQVHARTRELHLERRSQQGGVGKEDMRLQIFDFEGLLRFIGMHNGGLEMTNLRIQRFFAEIIQVHRRLRQLNRILLHFNANILQFHIAYRDDALHRAVEDTLFIGTESLYEILEIPHIIGAVELGHYVVDVRVRETDLSFAQSQGTEMDIHLADISEGIVLRGFQAILDKDILDGHACREAIFHRSHMCLRPQGARQLLRHKLDGSCLDLITRQDGD